jgi:hypothetical protein
MTAKLNKDILIDNITDEQVQDYITYRASHDPYSMNYLGKNFSKEWPYSNIVVNVLVVGKPLYKTKANGERV